MLLQQEPAALQAGSRDFAALADRCWALAAALRARSAALCQGPGGWHGAAAEQRLARADRLAGGLDQAAEAGAQIATTLARTARVVADARATWEQAAGLARSAGAELTPDGGIVGPGTLIVDPARQPALRAAGDLATEALAAIRGADTRAAAELATTGDRASLAAALAGREGPFEQAVEERLHGPISPLRDFAAGFLHGARELAAGTVGALLLGSPSYRLLRPMQAARQEQALLDGVLAAARHPGEALRLALATDDLHNGHAARFWGQFGPQLLLAAVTKGAGDLAEAGAAAAGTRVGEVAAGSLPPGLATSTLGLARSVPLGFADAEQFTTFGARLGRGLRAAGYPGARVYLRGSAVTGVSHQQGLAFDLGRVSDFDLAVADPALFGRAAAEGVPLRTGGTRTVKLGPALLRRYGLLDLKRELDLLAGRDVSFMVYASPQAVAVRGACVEVPVP